ncbi:phage tail assembly protein [Brevundimonas faecalis]|uniref:phage tail assembly protein n=1 Tax=Brevundimonas faecalis TaxID=947378 RepID=UPI003614AE8F
MTDTNPETHKTFTLAFPKDFNGEKVKSVTLRRPSGREIRALQNGSGSQIDKTFEMMATLADRELDLFDTLDGADLRAIDKWLEGVLGE